LFIIIFEEVIRN